MKKGILLTVLAAFIIVLTAHSQEKETRDLRGFSNVASGISGELYIDIGSEYSVTLEGNRNDLDEIVTEVTSGKLVIKHKRTNWNFTDNRKVIVHVTLPELTGLSVSGSGKAEVTESIKEADELTLSVSGSGRILMGSIVADKLNCNISGSGNIVIDGEGNADSGEISVSGSGNYHGENMEIDHLTVRLSGSGNCLCKAGDELTASVSGSGNVNYIGNPKVDARVSGSGRVRSR